MKNAVLLENGYAKIATPNGVIETTRLHVGRYVSIDDTATWGIEAKFPQLCAGAGRCGSTLIYRSPEQFSRDCNARLYRTRSGFERAASAISGF